MEILEFSFTIDLMCKLTYF